MTGLRAFLFMSLCLGLLTLAPLSAVNGDDADNQPRRVADSAEKRPATRAREGGENQPTHKLRGASKTKKTTPKTDFGTVAAPGAKKAPPATDPDDTLDE